MAAMDLQAGLLHCVVLQFSGTCSSRTTSENSGLILRIKDWRLCADYFYACSVMLCCIQMQHICCAVWNKVGYGFQEPNVNPRLPGDPEPVKVIDER